MQPHVLAMRRLPHFADAQEQSTPRLTPALTGAGSEKEAQTFLCKTMMLGKPVRMCKNIINDKRSKKNPYQFSSINPGYEEKRQKTILQEWKGREG